MNQAKRPEEVIDNVSDHIWDAVNVHVGTSAHSFPELVEQLGIMRFGHRPRVADTFCGSGQIPFEAARLGCNAYASDINPVASMLTWGAFNAIGGSNQFREALRDAQHELATAVQTDIDALEIETDGHGWTPKTFLYCIETRCPQTGWRVPLLSTRLISKPRRAIAELIPDFRSKRFMIQVRSAVSVSDLLQAQQGTVRSDGRGQEPYLFYLLDSVEYRIKISTLRGDFSRPDGTTGNKLRLWEKHDFIPRADDIVPGAALLYPMDAP